MGRDKRRGLSRLPWVFGLVVLMVGVCALALALNVPSARLPILPVRVGPRMLAVAGGLFFIAGLVIVLLPTHLGLRIGLLGAIVSFATACGFAWSFRGPAKGDLEVDFFKPRKTWSSNEEWTERYIEKDATFGHRGIPNVAAIHHHREFNVTYDHDADGFRRMPAPRKSPPLGEIAFLGCSYTYGVGVENDQTFPYLLAKRAWADFKVVNESCPGWGTNHVHVALEELLRQPRKPACIFYVFFDGHFQRNGSRASWHRRINMPYPHVNSLGNYQGLKPSSFAKQPDSPDQDRQERQITTALIRKMNDDCRKSNVPFIVLVLQVQEEKDMQVVAGIPGLQWIDLRAVCEEYFRFDGHPTPRSHQAIAWWLANDPRVAEFARQPSLYNPTAFSREEFDPASLVLRFYAPHEGNDATLVRLRERGLTDADVSTKEPAMPTEKKAKETVSRPGHDWVRVENIRLAKPNLSVLQLAAWLGPIERGKHYEYSFRARADRPRSSVVGIFNRIPPIRPVVPTNKIELFPEWREYRFAFESAVDQPWTALRLSLGESDVPIEIADVRMEVKDSPAPDAFVLDTPCAASGVQARLVEKGPGQYRIEDITPSAKEAWCLQCTQRGISFKSGTKYVVTGRFKADSPRSLTLTTFSSQPPLVEAGLRQTVTLKDSWEDIRIEFAAPRTIADGMFNIQFGDSAIPFEFSNVEVIEP